MCFSATASFTAASLLSVIGIASLKSIKNKNYTFLAAIPLLFGIQQFCEGVVWVSLNYGLSESLLYFFSYSFLLFAYILWPFWIPVSLYFLETQKQRKNWFIFLVLLGISLAIFLAYTVYMHGITPTISDQHITYDTNNYDNKIAFIALLIYFITTIVPFFLISSSILNIFGILLLLSAAISLYVWQVAFTSTWCFFSAILSSYLYLALSWKHKIE